MEGIDFGNVPSTLRWQIFPDFPEVDWESASLSEFELAANLKVCIPSPPINCAVEVAKSSELESEKRLLTVAC